VWQELQEGTARHGAQMPRREFFAAVVARLREALPPDLGGFHHRANTMLLKIDFGNERIHYEVWTDSARGRLEIGLHFEDGPASTAAYLAYFDARIVEIKHLLGPQIDLERWTLSWGHLFESASLPPLDRRLASAVGDRLVAQITVLQPMVMEAAVPTGHHEASANQHRRWRKRP
jgi:hypothetical protein